MSQKITDTLIEAAKVSPAVAVLQATQQGLTLQEWVYVATLVYLGLQAAWLLWKWYRAARTRGWSPSNE